MAETRRRAGPCNKTHKPSFKEAETPPSRGSLRSFFTCKHHQSTQGAKTFGCSGSSICNLKDNPRLQMQQRAGATPPEPCKRRSSVSSDSSRSLKAPLSEINGPLTTSSISSSSSIGGSFRGVNLRRLSGCYEWRHMASGPISGVSISREPSFRTLCSCPDCGEIFMKSESLELHQTTRHAVTELGPEDTSRSIVEMIFQSSWIKRGAPSCKIDRILKVQNSKKRISRFEEYRDCIRNRVGKKHPRCAADGNELLRFYCTTVKCSIGHCGATSLCDSACGVCGIIRSGFKGGAADGRIATVATTGRAHDGARMPPEEQRAMLVCRVIAGRVKRGMDEEGDSVAGGAETGAFGGFDKLFVFSSRAILPCFVVIYRC